MEDRFTPGLYLEMSDLEPSRYAGERVPEVLTRPGVRRATWWENVRPDRSELPRELPEFRLLGVFEVDAAAGFSPPAAGNLPPGLTAYHFRHYPRPAQGRLTGRPTTGLLLVLISPKDVGDDVAAQALRDWADFVHISHIAETGNPGYTMITPYENVTGRDPRFLHLYEMDTDDPEAAYRAMTPRVIDRLGGGFGTPDFDGWAGHPALRIMYVNTFRRLGVAPGATGASA